MKKSISRKINKITNREPSGKFGEAFDAIEYATWFLLNGLDISGGATC